MKKEGSKFKRLYRGRVQIEGNFKDTDREVSHTLGSGGWGDLYRVKSVVEKLF
jgi:hypothetical protein